MYIHPQALVETERIGEGTRVWAFAHVMKGAIVGKDCNLGDGAFVEAGAVLGDRVTVKNQVMIWEGVRIADDVFIGPGVIFTNDLRPRSPRMTAVLARCARKENWLAPTAVNAGASIGAGAVILAGTTLGAYCLIAAGAVVTKNVTPHALMAGNPARRAGWVCCCGARLDAQLTCAECQSKYTLAGDQLAACSAD